ncbi:HAD family hydrolase [Candidatus Woesearchaeota archaeon]|nr:HAD family hydrolase [Candidatus Woesearchaeota archaeon]
MTAAILFDFWGTLVETGIPSPLKQIKEMLSIRLPFSEYVVRLEQVMMTRKFDSLKEAFEAVCQEFRLRYRDEQIEELIGLWNKSWMLAQPYPEVAEQLAELKKKYRLILISNTDCFSIGKVVEKFNLGEYFERQFFSCQIGLLKTNPAFLNKVLQELDVSVKDCVLVGDSLESDMNAAGNVGMKGILMDRRDRREFQPKIKNLTELEGVL